MSDLVNALDKPITWASAARLALAFAGEFTLISLLNEAPDSLKYGTILCSLSGLLLLESRKWLLSRYVGYFYILSLLILSIYLCFVVYAWYAKSYQNKTVALVQQCYVDSVQFATRKFKLNPSGVMDQGDLNKYVSDFKNWENKCADEILSRANAAARERFLDKSEMPYTIRYQNEADRIMDALVADRKNLSILLSNRGLLE